MESNNSVFLIGFMGCGKSSVAEKLANMYRFRHLEMDEVIEHRAGMSISSIFEKYGEETFRDMETQMLRDVSPQEVIISCGGGTPLREENRKLMKEKGKVVFLTASPETVIMRINPNQTDRPLLRGHVTEEYIRDMQEKRRPHYEACADYIIKTDHRSIDDICQEIIEKCAR